MPVEIKYDGAPAGYPTHDAAEGDMVEVVVLEFLTSGDGELFTKRLEGLPAEILQLLNLQHHIQISESQIDNMLVLYSLNKATVYVNEIKPTMLALAKRDIKPGAQVTDDDIADIARIQLNISVPEDAGIFYISSLGWRKSLFYDLNPCYGRKRDYDLSQLLAAQYSFLHFQHVFGASGPEWDALMSAGWFPFVSLRRKTIESMFWSARTGKNFEKLIEIVAADLEENLDSRFSAWRNNPLAAQHLPFIERAINHYRNTDFVSAALIMYPQIEGLMRTFHQAQGLTSSQSQAGLATSIVLPHSRSSHHYSFLLPEQFSLFLKEVYFRSFDAHNPTGVSRNTISHGVVKSEELDKKAALLSLLLVDQILFYMRLEVHAPTTAVPSN